MRNLKRVLSLTLASAMLFGMMVMGASAADKKPLTDLDKVINKEAVNLMVDLGIIAGKPDGSFAPAETVDRATMAKLIYFIMMGTADESAFKGVNTGLTDVKGNWAEGFINYCYSVKIVAGTGDNAYNPNGKVTVASAAKMLLVALGYDSDASKYQNDPMWSVNITRDAQTAGLLKGIDQASSAELTRDNAAQMIYNALFANTVKPDFEIDQGIKYLKGYNAIKDTDGVVVTLATTNYNLKKFTGVVVGNEFAAVHSGASVQDAGKTQIFPYITTEGTTKGDVNAAGAKTVKVATDVSMLGQEVVYYTHGKDNTESSSVTATGKTKEFTWTDDKINEAKFLTNNGLTKSSTYAQAENYVVKSPVGTAAKDGTRFIDSNADGKLDFSLKTAYTFSKVTKVDSTNITITGLGTRKLADVSGSADLKKDEYVNFATVGTSGKATVEKAAEITGTVTSLKDGKAKAVIGGTTYTVAADAGKAGLEAPAEVAKTYIDALTLSKAVEGIFYLNKEGKLAVYLPTEEGASTTSMYAYVTALNKTTSFSTINIEAKVVLADGTQQTLTVVDNNSKANNADKNGLYDTAAATGATLTDLVGVYPYTLNKDGEMVAGEKATTKTTIASTYTAGKPTMDLATTDILMDANTTVLFYDNSDASNVKISSYKGVNNVPGIANGKSVTPVVVAGKTFATFVLVEAVGVTATADYAYALGNTYASQTADGYVYNMVINGVKETLTTKDEVDMRIGNIYTYGVDDKGIATLSAPVAITGIGTVKSVADKYVVIGTDSIELATDYTVDDLTATDADGAIVPSDGVLAKDSKIIYIVSGTKLVKAYVINDGKVAGVDGFNKGALISVDGYDVTLTGTLTDSNTLKFKFSAPAGVSADSASVSGATATKAIADGNTSFEATVEYTTANADITVTIVWNSDYTETYTINTEALAKYVPAAP